MFYYGLLYYFIGKFYIKGLGVPVFAAHITSICTN